MAVLQGKNVVLGVSGSIAAYKAIYLTRLLVAEGATVWPVLTRGARRFVGSLSFTALAGRRAITNLFSAAANGEISHVEIAHQADVVVVAPASANTLARLALGLADDPLCAIALASRAPLCLAPAMETGMWEHPATVNHLQTLTQRGAHMVFPESGPLASGRSGLGRMAEPDMILERIVGCLSRQDLAGQHVVVTAGPTREAFDPVRFISNPSTGLMGFALARAARRRGAHVHLICGPTPRPPPPDIACTPITTTVELLAACQSRVPACTVLLMAAAPGDFRPAQVALQKEKKLAAPDQTTATLVRNPDILLTLKARRPGRVVVGFAAETHDFLQHGNDKLQRKEVDLLVVNPINTADSGFASQTNRGWLLSHDQEPVVLPLESKEALAERILDHVVARLVSTGAG